MTQTLTANSLLKSFQWLVITGLIWGLLITWGWSAENFQTTFESRQASIPVDQTSMDTEAPSIPAQAELSQDFLATSSPLSKPTPTPFSPPGNLVMTVEGTAHQCNESGNAARGAANCIQRYADGSFMESSSFHETMGDEKKEQTTVRYYHPDGKPAGEDTTRVKVSYYANSNIPEREYYDIVIQPVRGKINRDLIIKEFNSRGQLQKTTWAHYIEMSTRKAGLEHHAVLIYRNGQVLSGLAHQYKNGRLIDTLLNYNPSRNPNLRMEKSGVLKWTRWIDQLIHQAKPHIS